MITTLKKQNQKHILLFAILFVIGIITRFYNIEKIPPFVPHDELGYFINAQALSLSGSDITGTWNPLSITPVTPTLAELTTHIIAPFYLLPLSPVLAGKLPFLIMSLLVPFFIAGIAYEFTKSKNVAAFAWFLSLFNPWIWQIGRMPFDPYTSFFFYILGAYLLLKLKNWHKIWSIIPLFVGFYQYQGHKLIFPIWVLAFTLYSIAPALHISENIVAVIQKSKIKQIFPQITILFLSLFLFLFYLLMQLPNQKSKDRLNTLFLPSSPEIVQMVNEQRRLSIDTPLNSLIVNKYTLWAGRVFERFTETYSFKFLFLEGQVSNSSWSVWNHGIFYIADSILIILGFVYLLQSKRYKFILFLCLFLSILVVPSLISADKSYFFRSSMNIPIILILAAVGAEYARKSLPNGIKILLIVLYFFVLFHFTYLYLVRYPLIASDRQFFSDRILAEYLRRIPDSQKVVLFSPEPEFAVSTYLFFNNILDKKNIDEIQEMYQQRNYQIGAKKFIGDCLPIEIVHSDEVIISRHDIRKCEPDESTVLNLEPLTNIQTYYNPLQIQAIKDSGAYYHIYNDQLCSGLEINPYLRINKIDYFDFEKMSNTEFCQTWISKLNTQTKINIR